MMSVVTEVVLFRLKADITDTDFLQEATIAQTWVEQQEGYLGRELLKTSDGQWLDTVRWTGIEVAENAAQEIMNTAHCVPFINMIDETSMQMWHFEPQVLPVK